MADATARFILDATDNTGRAFATADRNLRQFTRGISSARTLASAFGIALSGRVFANWIAGGIRAAEVTGEHAEQIKHAKDALEGMKKASDELAASIGVKLVPVFETIAQSFEGWRQAIAPTEIESLQAELRGTYEEAARLAAEIEKVDSRGMLGQVFFGTAGSGALKQDLDAVKAKAGELLTRIVDLQRAQGPPVFAPNVHRIGTFADRNKGALSATTAINFLDEFEEITVQARKISEDEILNPFPASRVRELFDPIKDEGKFTAEFIGDQFRDSFTDWILGAEHSFRDLLKRMAAEMATSALFQGLASFFPGGSFFSKFFGGSRASGGYAREGMVYKVHPGEAFFAPGMNGHVGAVGGGSIVIHQTNTFHGGDRRQQAAAIAANNARLKQEIKAEISDARRRGRPI